MDFRRNKVDPCVYWVDEVLMTWLCWVDDCMISGDKDDLFKHEEMMEGMFDCDEVRELKEHVGCELCRDWEKKETKITQSVLLQSCTTKF